jgi:hypothetical protein
MAGQLAVHPQPTRSAAALGAPRRPDVTKTALSQGYYAPTMALQRFERRLERFVEGAFARVFRSGLQPVEIGRRLTREMDLRRTVAPKGVLAPNAFKVLLSPADRAKFQAIEAELIRELVEVAREHAAQEGYSFLGPLRVVIETDGSLRPGTLLVAGDMTPDQGVATLLLPDGRRVVLESQPVTLGRLPECDLALADSGVSRRHAVVQPALDGTWVVVDLGSTNGTKVNGVRIAGEHTLRDGDELTLGSTTLRFEVRSQPAAGPGQRQSVSPAGGQPTGGPPGGTEVRSAGPKSRLGAPEPSQRGDRASAMEG